MGRGIKTSKSIVFNVSYETYPDSGDSSLYSHDDFYIVGVGIDKLARCVHEQVYSDEVKGYITVYLESDESESQEKWTWNKTLEPSTSEKDGIFKDSVDSISSDEFDDINLKAKWVQYITKGDITEEYSDSQTDVILSNEEGQNVIFSWL